MKAKFERSYKSKNGNTVFVYSVSGDKNDMENFSKAQGDYYRVDENTGKPLWFTTRFIGDNGKLIITSNGKVVPDMSLFDQAASLAAQYGGNLGEQLAAVAASQLLRQERHETSPEPQEEKESM